MNKVPKNFRKLSLEMRQEILTQIFSLSENEMGYLSNSPQLIECADHLVEASIGVFPIPLGIATGFLIDGQDYLIPMAIEESSVIAAASYGASLIARGGGFTTWSDPSIISGQIFLKDAPRDGDKMLQQEEATLGSLVNQMIPNMVKRGGGYAGFTTSWSEDRSTLCLTIDINVCDAMGANVVNTVMEGIKDRVETVSGGKTLMAILTNQANKRLAGASFRVPGRLFKKGVCADIVAATKVAMDFPDRAITHNKGVMNGVSAVALATGNDTRAIEAAAHFHAQKDGRYQPLTTFKYDSNNDELHGEIVLPLAVGTIGGSITSWLPSQVAMKILKTPNANRLAQIIAAVGLSQNFAALLALVTGGIQAGHMKLHKRKEQLIANDNSTI